MKIIVTGGAGFIGGNFIHHMVNKYPEYQIVNLDLLTYAGNLETLKPVENKPNYKFVKGDIVVSLQWLHRLLLQLLRQILNRSL